jgi:broad specificity phosphatase PhoE
MPRPILLIRHGCTALNKNDSSADKIRGWKDVPLNEIGRKEADKLGERLKGNGPDYLVSSDLIRAKETAVIISKVSGIPLELVTKSFRPWDVGKYAGTSSQESVPILAEMAEKQPDKRVPGGESFNTFKSRLFGGLYNLLRANNEIPGIVTHHRVERLLKAWQAAGYPKNGDIDPRVFAQKGEAPGHLEVFGVPVERIPHDAFSDYGWA